MRQLENMSVSSSQFLQEAEPDSPLLEGRLDLAACFHHRIRQKQQRVPSKARAGRLSGSLVLGPARGSPSYLFSFFTDFKSSLRLAWGSNPQPRDPESHAPPAEPARSPRFVFLNC